MSEYVCVETLIKDIEALKAALAEFGVEESQLEMHDVAVSLEGFGGDLRQQKANIVIRKRNVGCGSNDIGFELLPNGTYRAWISKYDTRCGLGKALKEKLMQMYAKHVILQSTAKQRGRRLSSCEAKGKKIRIAVTVD